MRAIQYTMSLRFFYKHISTYEGSFKIIIMALHYINVLIYFETATVNLFWINDVFASL